MYCTSNITNSRKDLFSSNLAAVVKLVKLHRLEKARIISFHHKEKTDFLFLWGHMVKVTEMVYYMYITAYSMHKAYNSLVMLHYHLEQKMDLTMVAVLISSNTAQDPFSLNTVTVQASIHSTSQVEK